MTWPHGEVDVEAERKHLKPGELTNAELAAWLERVIPPPMTWAEYWRWIATEFVPWEKAKGEKKVQRE